MTMVVIFVCLCILFFLYHNRKKLLTKIPVLLVGSAVVCDDLADLRGSAPDQRRLRRRHCQRH